MTNLVNKRDALIPDRMGPPRNSIGIYDAAVFLIISVFKTVPLDHPDSCTPTRRLVVIAEENVEL